MMHPTSVCSHARERMSQYCERNSLILYYRWVAGQHGLPCLIVVFLDCGRAGAREERGVSTQWQGYACARCQVFAHTMSKPTDLWLDCDPGHDDVMAILLATFSPCINLLGISTVHGNQTVDKTTHNAARFLTACGVAHIKVVKGVALLFALAYCESCRIRPLQSLTFPVTFTLHPSLRMLAWHTHTHKVVGSISGFGMPGGGRWQPCIKGILSEEIAKLSRPWRLPRCREHHQL